MNTPSSAIEPNAERRRSTRLTQSIPIKISGKDALSQLFQEYTTTLSLGASASPRVTFRRKPELASKYFLQNCDLCRQLCRVSWFGLIVRRPIGTEMSMGWRSNSMSLGMCGELSHRQTIGFVVPVNRKLQKSRSSFRLGRLWNLRLGRHRWRTGAWTVIVVQYNQ